MRRAEITAENAEQVYASFASPGPNALARNILFPALGALKGSKVEVGFMGDAEARIRDYPSDVGRLFIANHARESDAVCLTAAFYTNDLREVLNTTVTQAKSTLFRKPLYGPLVEAVGAIPVFRSQDIMTQDAGNNAAEEQQKHSLTLLAQFCATHLPKHNFMIFPQGTTEEKAAIPAGQKPLEALPFKPGIGHLVLHKEVPRDLEVVPMGIVYTPDSNMQLAFGRPFTPFEAVGAAENTRTTRETFRAFAQQQVQNCVDYLL